jgi:hypothetical protein
MRFASLVPQERRFERRMHGAAAPSGHVTSTLRRMFQRIASRVLVQRSR